MLQQNNIFEGHESVVLATDVNTEGTMLVTTSLDCKIRIFDLRTAKMLSFVTSQVGPYSCVKFSPDGSQFISGSRSGDVHVFDVKTGKMLKTYEIDSRKATPFRWRTLLTENMSQAVMLVVSYQ